MAGCEEENGTILALCKDSKSFTFIMELSVSDMCILKFYSYNAMPRQVGYERHFLEAMFINLDASNMEVGNIFWEGCIQHLLEGLYPRWK